MTVQDKERASELASEKAWLQLFELFSPTSSEVFYLTLNTAPIVFDSKTFLPFPIALGTGKSDTEGTIQSVELSVAVLNREIRNKLEEHNGFRKALVVVYLIHEDALNDPLSAVQQLFRVRSASTDNRVAILRLGQTNLYERVIGRRYNKLTCGFVYKGAACGYSLAFPSCDKTLNGANGCRVHGDDEVANSQPRMHPRRFGGFPGILRRR